MNRRTLTALTIVAGALALGEFGSAVMSWLEHTGPGAGALLAVFLGVLFFQISYGLVSLAGLIVAIALSAGADRLPRRDARLGGCRRKARPGAPWACG